MTEDIHIAGPGRSQEDLDDQHAEEYAMNAEFYELIFPETVVRDVGAGVRSVLPRTGSVVEIGSGTGLFTEILLDHLSAGSELFAIEPAPTMRAALTTRLARHQRAPSLTVLANHGLDAELPLDVTSVGGLVLIHVLSHFSPAARQALWRRWVPRLNSGGVVVCEPQWPPTPERVDPAITAGRALGRQRYESQAQAQVHPDPAGRPMMQWTMTYRTFAGETLKSEQSASFTGHVVSADTLDSELHEHGLQRIPDAAGVWAWRR